MAEPGTEPGRIAKEYGMDHVTPATAVAQTVREFGREPRGEGVGWMVTAGRLAPWGMGAGLVVFLAVVVGLGTMADWAGRSVEETHEASALVANAARKLEAARVLDRAYRARRGADPGTALARQFEAASQALVASVRQIPANRMVVDRSAGGGVVIEGQRYVQAVGHMFAAVDADDLLGVAAIDRAEVAPSHAALRRLLDRSAEALVAEVRAGLTSVERWHRAMLWAVPAAFVVCAGVIGFFWVAGRRAAERVEATLSRRAEAAVRSERRFRGIVQHARDLILVCDVQGRVVFQGPSAGGHWGFAEGGLLRQAVVELVEADDRALVLALWERAGEGTGVASLPVRLRDGAGIARPAVMEVENLVFDPAVDGVLVMVRDASEREAERRELVQSALYDEATGLPGRALMRDRVEQALVRARAGQTMVGVMVVELDLDVDGLGTAGLTEAAWRLRTSVRGTDSVGRIGDRLVVVLEGLHGVDDVSRPVERVEAHLLQAFGARGWWVGIAAGAGTERVDGLMGKAELALNRARGAGGLGVEGSGSGGLDDRAVRGEAALGEAEAAVPLGKQVVVFEEASHGGALDRAELEGDLRAANLSEELVLHFQPVMGLTSGAVEGVEALVRWQHPRHGEIAAGNFLAAAARTGLIVPLGHWVLEAACCQAAAWHRQMALGSPLVVSVNLSAEEFRDPGLLDAVTHGLRVSGLAPDCLMLEVSEGVLMADFGATIGVLWALKGLGVRLALDHFGTGCLGLPHLRQMPLDVLKMDGALVRGAEGGSERASLLGGVAMGRSLGLRVVGEGIETAEQAAAMATAGCELGQGWHFGRPGDAEAMTAWLRGWTRAGRGTRARV